jgi:uncharacterized membrane protein YjfL (UPF0719 family)
MSEILTAPLAVFFSALPLFALAFVLLLLGKEFFDRTTPYSIDTEITGRDNAAFGLCLSGYLLGLAIALAGGFSGTGTDLFYDLGILLVNGIASILLLRASIYVNDKWILSQFSVDREMIQDRNAGTGAVVAGTCIATGLLLNGILTGESAGYVSAVRDVLIYWVCGQILLIAGGQVFQWITSYDVHRVVGKEDNVPAGVSFGGFMVGLGFVARAGITRAQSHVFSELVRFAVIGVLGLILLACARVVADRVLMPKSSLTKEVVKDRNLAAGLLAATTFITVAILLAAAITALLPVDTV